jgi:hypothetical protein
MAKRILLTLVLALALVFPSLSFAAVDASASPSPRVEQVQESAQSNGAFIMYSARFCYGYTVYDRFGNAYNGYSIYYWSDGFQSYVRTWTWYCANR